MVVNPQERIGAPPVFLLKKQVVRLILLFCACMLVLLQIDYSQTAGSFKFDKNEKTDYFKSGFLIDTKGCRILDLDPFDPSLVQYFGDEEPLDCNPSRLGSLVLATDTELYVDQTVVPNYTTGFLSCCYRPFTKRKHPPGKEGNQTYLNDIDEEITFSEFCYEFSDSVVVKDEFVMVTCTSDTGQVVFKELFSFFRNPYHPGDKEYMNNVNSDRLSVLVVGFDGMSRLNFLRQLPRTLDFLQQHDVISLMGYNKVGYNTFPNLMPVLTGRSEAELKKRCWHGDNEYFDNCTFIWSEFKRQGYVTSYGEDTPYMSTFYYVKRGFKRKPVDFYPRPFTLLAEKELGSHHRLNVKLCTGNKLSSQVFNSLIKSFSYMMRDQLTFGFFWGNSLSHDYLNLPRVGDKDFRDLLIFFKQNGVLNKTALILMSDHGIRWGSFRTTYQGFLEERLPFVHFLLPGWFKDKYSVATANLQINKKRLTSPFDLYQTLKDLSNLSRLADDVVDQHKAIGRGISLFRRISSERKCHQAGVPVEWCACHTDKPLSTSSQESLNAAAGVVIRINNLLIPYPQCSRLELAQLVNARLEEVPNKESLKFAFKDIVVTLETTPGNAVFEATVRYKSSSGYTVLGAISRLNVYGNQSSCVPHDELRLYCYCNNQS